MDPPLCVNSCGFYGNPATRNLCSKCYEDLVLKQSMEALLPAVTDGMKTVSIEEAKEAVQSEDKQRGESRKQTPNRCGLCKKRLGLTGFSCRCGGTFCAVHRFWDQHGCSFDFKTLEKGAIASKNPVIKANKLDRI